MIEIVVLVVMLPAQRKDQIWTGSQITGGVVIFWLSPPHNELVHFTGERLRDTIVFVIWRKIQRKRKASNQELRTPKRERNLIFSISDCA